jgi:hypothetical protein
VLRLVVVAALVAFAFPVSAEAALSFSFDRTQAKPGQVVHAFQADSDGNPVPAWGDGDFDPSSVTIYLVRLRAPFAWRLRLGPMQVDDRGVWNIAFRIPRKIRAGLYTTAFFCRPCGNTYFPSTTTHDMTSSRVLRIRTPRR